MKIQGGIDMGMSVGSAATNCMLMQDWNNVVRDVREAAQPAKGASRGMALYYKAMRDCDKAMENVMDKHHESVAKSAKKMKEYRKKKARENAIKKAADDRRAMNEEATARAMNYRDFMQELRFKEEAKRATFQMVA